MADKEKDSSSTPAKGTGSKIPIRVGSLSEASPKMSRVPARFGCESPAKLKKVVEKSHETLLEIKNTESAGACYRKMEEPHRLTLSESLPFAPTKGSEGDQFLDAKHEKEISVDFSVEDRKPSLNVLMEPRDLRENSSGMQIVNSECIISPIRHGCNSVSCHGSKQSLCPDKSCEEAGDVNEVESLEYDVAQAEELNVWKPVSDYLLERSKTRTMEAQTSEASNIDDMDCVDSEKYSVYSTEKASKIPTIPGRIKPCTEINSIKIRHPAAKCSLAKLAATAIGIPVIDCNPDIPVLERIPNDSPSERGPTEKGDLKRKDTYTVFTEDTPKELTVMNDGGDGNQNSSEMNEKTEAPVETLEMAKNVLCVNISKITPAVLRAISDSAILPVIDVYPQALLLIPDGKNPGRYIATLKIMNNSANIRAYKICMNKCASNAFVIQPQYGILNQYSEIAIEIRSRSCNNDFIGGLSQNSVNDAVLEIRSVEVFNIANQRQLSKLWRMAESRFRDSISSVKIRSINVLEPRNKRVLGVFEEEDAKLLKDIMEAKYNNEILPKMMENRESHLMDIELAIIEGRIQKVWSCVRHMDFYLDLGLATTYFATVYLGILPWMISYIHPGNNAQDIPPDPVHCDSIMCKFSRFFLNLMDFP